MKIGRGRYDLKASIQRYAGNLRAVAAGHRGDSEEIDLVTERALLARQQRIAQEIKNDLACGEVVPIDVVIEEIGNLISISRTRLLSIPSKVAGRFPGRDRAVLQDLIMDGVCEALTELSQAEELKTVKKARAAQRKAASRKAAA